MIVFGAVALLLAPVQDGKVELRWKFVEGQALRYRMEQTIVLEGSTRKLSQKTATTYRLKVGRVDREGRGTITFTYEAFAFTHEAGDRRITYDSRTAGDKPPHPAVQLQARLVGRSFKMTLTPSGRVVNVEGVDRLIDLLVADHPKPDAARRTLREMFSPDTLKSMMQQMAPTLPERKVARRDRWKDEYTLTMPMVGKMDFTVVSELGGVENGIARFDQEMMIDFKAAGAGVGVEVSAIRGKAQNRFSVERGVFLSSRSTLDVTLKSGEATVPMSVTGELRLLD